jgi:hypothetical protein
MEHRSHPPRRPAKRFQPATGHDFDLAPAPSIEATTKDFFVRTLVVAALFALALTGFFGLKTSEYGPIQTVWVVVGPIMGAMVNHYFGGRGKD